MGDAIQPSHPLLPASSPALNLSQHQIFSNESALCIRRPQYWSFSISPSNEYSGLISFRIDWFDLQGTLKSLLQHHSSKASIHWCSAFFMVQLSHPYMTTGKTIALSVQIFVSKYKLWYTHTMEFYSMIKRNELWRQKLNAQKIFKTVKLFCMIL